MARSRPKGLEVANFVLVRLLFAAVTGRRAFHFTSSRPRSVGQASFPAHSEWARRLRDSCVPLKGLSGQAASLLSLFWLSQRMLGNKMPVGGVAE